MWLPVDAKFPRDDYERLLDAQDRADPAAADIAARALEARIRTEAKSIADSYLSEMIVLPDAALIGKRLGECGFARLGIRVVRIVRGGDFVTAGTARKLQAGDVLLFVGNAGALVEVKAMQGIEIHPEVKLGSVKGPLEQDRIAEAVVLPDSRLVGSTLREVALLKCGLMNSS